MARYLFCNKQSIKEKNLKRERERLMQGKEGNSLFDKRKNLGHCYVQAHTQ